MSVGRRLPVRNSPRRSLGMSLRRPLGGQDCALNSEGTSLLAHNRIELFACCCWLDQLWHLHFQNHRSAAQRGPATESDLPQGGERTCKNKGREPHHGGGK